MVAKARKMSVAERRKAEEIIRDKFKLLRDGVCAAADSKLREIEEEWTRQSGVAKLRDKIKSLQGKIKAINAEAREKMDRLDAERQEVDKRAEKKCEEPQKKIDELTAEENSLTGMVGYGRDQKDDPAKRLPLVNAKNRVMNAREVARTRIGELRAEAVKQLWFASFDSEVLGAIDSIPSVLTVLKGNALFHTPAAKMLTNGPASK